MSTVRCMAFYFRDEVPEGGVSLYENRRVNDLDNAQGLL